MASNPQSLLSDSSCYACYGIGIADAMKLSLLSSIAAGGGATPNTLVLFDGINPPTVIVNPVGSFTYNATAWVSITANSCVNITEMVVTANGSLTSFSILGAASFTGPLTVQLNPVLAACNFSGITQVNGTVEISNNAALASINVSALANVGTTFRVTSNNSLTSLNTGVLATISSALEITGNSVLPSISLPALTFIGFYYQTNNNLLLTSLNVSAIQTIANSIDFRNNPMLSSVAFSSISIGTLGSILFFNDCTNLVSFSMNGCLILTDAGGLFAENCNLNQATVDLLLNATNDAGSSSGDCLLDGGTNAAPSAAGLLVKTNLIGNGVNCVTN
jgi:hypothetical protein